MFVIQATYPGTRGYWTGSKWSHKRKDARLFLKEEAEKEVVDKFSWSKTAMAVISIEPARWVS